MKKLPISIASYSFHGLLENESIDIFTYLEALKNRYNVDYADIWSGFLDELDADYLKKIRASMDEKGIKLANLCVDGPHVWVDDADQRAAHKNGAIEYIKAAEILGAKSMRLDMGSMEEDIPAEKFDYIAATYLEYCKMADGFGMRIGTENHWGSSRVPANLEKLYNAVNHPAYGHLFHFGNFIDGHIEEGLETVLKMAMHTHVSADSVVYAKEYIRRLVNAGYKGTFSVEHHSGKLEYQRVAWQLATVRGMIAELQEEGFEEPAKACYFNEIYSGAITLL